MFYECNNCKKWGTRSKCDACDSFDTHGYIFAPEQRNAEYLISTRHRWTPALFKKFVTLKEYDACMLFFGEVFWKTLKETRDAQYILRHHKQSGIKKSNTTSVSPLAIQLKSLICTSFITTSNQTLFNPICRQYRLTLISCAKTMVRFSVEAGNLDCQREFRYTLNKGIVSVPISKLKNIIEVLIEATFRSDEEFLLTRDTIMVDTRFLTRV